MNGFVCGLLQHMTSHDQLMHELMKEKTLCCNICREKICVDQFVFFSLLAKRFQLMSRLKRNFGFFAKHCKLLFLYYTPWPEMFTLSHHRAEMSFLMTSLILLPCVSSCKQLPDKRYSCLSSENKICGKNMYQTCFISFLLTS